MESANGADPEAQANDVLEGCLGPETVEQANLSNRLRWQDSVTTVGIHSLAMVAATTHRAVRVKANGKTFHSAGSVYILFSSQDEAPSPQCLCRQLSGSVNSARCLCSVSVSS